MITIRTMKQIATCRMIPGFRACRSLGRSHPTDSVQIAAERLQMLDCETHRQWRNKMWQRSPTRQR